MSILYPFYEEVQAVNPDITLRLIGDNTPTHTRAARHYEEERQLRNIHISEWPPNSPDLYIT